MTGTQDFQNDPRNEAIQIYLNGNLVPRQEAVVSVFDSGFILGDGIWEGLRIHGSKLAFLDRHLDRLFKGLKAIDLDIGMSRPELVHALDETLARNNMVGDSSVHLRIMVTRGEKRTPNQDPRHTISGATVVIVPEYKKVNSELHQRGVKLFTSSIRCTRADMFDMQLNSHSRLNLITALIQAIKSGSDEALMLDDRGFISSCNATNFFFVKSGTVKTSTGQSCFRGITRSNVIELCEMNNICCVQSNFTLADVYDADEAFVSGSFAGLTPVREIDGRKIQSCPGQVRARLQELYLEYAENS